MAAWEHSSSLPGDPDTPTAPTISSPALIGKPPEIASTRLYSLEPTEAGSLSIRFTKSADEVPKVRDVGLAIGPLGRVQPCAIAAQHDERQAGTVHDNNRDLEAQFLALIHRGFGDRLRHRQRDVLLVHELLRAGARAQRERIHDCSQDFESR